jgi:hypothetical protein
VREDNEAGAPGGIATLRPPITRPKLSVGSYNAPATKSPTCDVL